MPQNKDKEQREDERHQVVGIAVADEKSRFNTALANGKAAILHTALGDYYVNSVNTDWWYSCRLHREKSDWLTDRSFAGCNNGSWDDLMQQVGEARHPLFSHMRQERK